MIRKNSLKLFAIAASALIVAAGTGYVIMAYHPRTAPRGEPVGQFGPKVTVSPYAGTDDIANNTTVNVQIFSPVPDAFAKTGLSFYSIPSNNQWNNSVNDELLNVTLLPGNNTTAFFLSSEFNTIAQEWVPLLSHDTGTNYPSLSVYAVKTVVSNGTASLYTYYNNMLYNPFELSVVRVNSTLIHSGAVSNWFNNSNINPAQYSQIYLADLSFNLTLVFPSTPSQLISLNSTSTDGSAVV